MTTLAAPTDWLSRCLAEAEAAPAAGGGQDFRHGAGLHRLRHAAHRRCADRTGPGAGR